ncbi:nudix hydrolase 20, chloroplastic-like isoform X2 [Lytechinus variegatus]|nr:nudix hydrolase 20, chloroplastic-like isoform X2 [Lytechinus variegatus]
MFGRDRNKAAKERMAEETDRELKGDYPGPRKKRKRLQQSKKKGCPAKVIMKEVILFPQFKSSNMSKYVRDRKSSAIRNSLTNGEQIEAEHRIYIQLPSLASHQNTHSQGPLIGSLNPLAKEIRGKIQELVGHGVSETKEIRRHLKIYVNHLFPNPAERPHTTNTAYYPTDTTIRNHIYAARMRLGEMTGTSPLAQSWSRRMWSAVQRAASSFTWEGEKKLRYLPFMVDGVQVGIIPPKMVETLASQPDIFELKNNQVHLSSTLSTYAERTARVGEFLSTCRESVDFITLQGWRNENYAVSRSYYDTPLFEMERSATCLFGIKQYGVHVNGYCRHPTEGICMWIGKRSPNKQTYPGKLDQIAAGGLPACLDIRECMMKESEEEASIPRDISSKALPVGAISYFFEDERGVFPETQFIFDLELPVDFQPRVKDGEVSEFYLWSLSKVKEEIATDRFKPNCSLVCLDFLIRHGYINHDGEPHYLDFLSSLHQTHF